MTEDDITEIVLHPLFTRAVDRRVRAILGQKRKPEPRGYLPETTLEGTGVVSHEVAAKRHNIAEGTLINYIADGLVLGDAQSVHEPDLIEYLLTPDRPRRNRQ